MKTALLISGGEYSPVDSLHYNYIIACDKGTEYAKRMKLVPDVIIGDFDSMDGNARDMFPDSEILSYPVEKDDTDTMLAIKLALSEGYSHIIIICALGNRLDHTMANLQSLHYICANGGVGEIISDTEHLLTIGNANKKISLSKLKGYSLSLFSLTDSCKGVCIKGAKYELTDYTLINTFPLGLGNDFIKDTVDISLEEGSLLLIQSKL